MRILVIGGYAPSLTVFRGHLLREMVRRGHQVWAAAADGTPAIERQLTAMGVRYHELGLRRAGMNPLTDGRTLVELVRLMRRLHPELVLTYTVKPVIYGSLAARVAGVPRIHALVTGLGYAFMGQDTGSRRLLNQLVCGLYRASLAGTTGVMFQNPDDKALFEQLGLLPRGRPIVIVNGSGVDVEHFVPSPLPPGGPTFLFIGRLLREKGLVEFVEAARLVRRQIPRARFQLLGPFDPNPASVSQAELDGWVRDGIVEYLGETDDVRPYIAAATALVLPSYREGTPRSVLEAMAMGRPIVTTDAPGCRETIVDGDSGLLVPVRDAAAVAHAVARLASEPALAQEMGRRSRARAEAKYDVRLVTRSMLDAMGVT